VDYAAVAATAKSIVEGKPYHLVERGRPRRVGFLKKFRVESVTVRIRKFSVPQAESVGVEISVLHEIAEDL